MPKCHLHHSIQLTYQKWTLTYRKSKEHGGLARVRVLSAPLHHSGKGSPSKKAKRRSWQGAERFSNSGLQPSITKCLFYSLNSWATTISAIQRGPIVTAAWGIEIVATSLFIHLVWAGTRQAFSLRNHFFYFSVLLQNDYHRAVNVRSSARVRT